jgi:hypothetical protein
VRRWTFDSGGVAGLVFAVVLPTAIVLLDVPDSHQSRAKFVAYYVDFRGSSHEWRHLVANLLAILAAFSFVWFLRRLYSVVRRVDASLAAVVSGAGFLFLALMLAALVATSAVGTALAYTDGYRVDIDTAILMSNVGLFLYTAAGVGSGAMIWAASLAARRGALFPRVVVWGGFAAGVAALATIAIDGAGLVLPLVWILIVSVLFLRVAPPQESVET